MAETWVYEANRRLRALLSEELAEGDVVVTHHLPSRRSIAPRYRHSPLNCFFLCDQEELIVERRPALWLHGHTHSSVDRQIGSTRIACNPFGYAVAGGLNSGFIDRLVIEIGSLGLGRGRSPRSNGDEGPPIVLAVSPSSPCSPSSRGRPTA